MRDLWKKYREPSVFGLFLLGAVAFTYPLVKNLRTAVTDHFDPLLDAWTLAWVAHQLPRDPAHLFDANRFYPESGSLAFHDPMPALSVLLAPFQWTFGEPVLTLNLGMLLSLALSGYGAYRLGKEVTGSSGAGGGRGKRLRVQLLSRGSPRPRTAPIDGIHSAPLPVPEAISCGRRPSATRSESGSFSGSPRRLPLTTVSSPGFSSRSRFPASCGARRRGEFRRGFSASRSH